MLILMVFMFVMFFPLPATAYVGPGLGVGMIGAILGVVLSVVLALIGIVWYPLKRLFNKSEKRG